MIELKMTFQIRSQVQHKVRKRVWDYAWVQVGQRVRYQAWNQICDQVSNQVRGQAQFWVRNRIGGLL